MTPLEASSSTVGNQSGGQRFTKDASNGVTREQRQYLAVRWSVVLAAGAGLTTLVWISLAQAQYVWPLLHPQSPGCGCQTPAALLSPFVAGLFVAALSLTAVMISRAGWRFGRRARADRQLNRFVHQHGRLVTHLPTGCQYWLVPDVTARAMTIGLARPQVVVTTGLVQSLTKTELASVLRHEQRHKQAADPFWSALLESLGAAWFWFPGMKNWIQAAFRLRELAADQAAIQNESERASLGSAVVKLALAEPGPIPAFSPNRDRVEKLLNPSWQPRLGLWRWSTVLSLGLVLTGLVLLGRWTQATAAAVPARPGGSCQEVMTVCRLTRPAVSSSAILCLNQDGWRCRWLTAPRMSADGPFSRY